MRTTETVEMTIFNSLKLFRMATRLLSHQPLNPLVIVIISSMSVSASTITITVTMDQFFVLDLGG